VTRPEHRALEGHSIADLAGDRDPLDAFFDLALAEDLDTVFSAQLVNADEDELTPLLRHPCGVIALSDAGAHLSFLCDAGYGCTFLGHWVRKRQAFTLPEAVRKLTSIPATIYGLLGRGRIAEGYAADLLLFDPARVAAPGRAASAICRRAPADDTRYPSASPASGSMDAHRRR